MKKLLVLVLTLAVVSLYGGIWINEFCVTPTASEFLELFNDGTTDYDLTGHYLIEGGSSWAETLSLDGLTVPAAGFLVIDSTLVSGFGLPNEGGWMKIVDASYNVLDSVAYGNQGPAPAPIYQWSSARMTYTGDLALDFNMDDTPTKGAVNDASVTQLGTSSVIINEILPNTTTTQFVELYNNGSSAVDISNWVIICDDDYYIASGTSLNPGEYFVLLQSDFPPYFYMDDNYDDIYLFDNNLSRVDQVGWSVSPVDSSFSVIPNGVRTVYDGYSTETSVDFQWTDPTQGAENTVTSVDYYTNENTNVSYQILNGTVLFTIKGNAGENVSIDIYDISGRNVRHVDYTLKGTTKMPFNLDNGIYVYKVSGRNINVSGKFVIVK